MLIPRFSRLEHWSDIVDIFQNHELSFRPMDRANARAIIRWRYEAPYDIYNLNAIDIENAVHDYVLPENAYYSVHNRNKKLVGYCCFGREARVPGGDYRADALDVGLGLHPDLTGRGHGRKFVRAILEFARMTYHPGAFRMTVAAWNARAIRLYAHLGFHRIQEFPRETDGELFAIMVRREL